MHSIKNIALILCFTMIGCGDWTGTYCRGESWQAEEFTINADSTFSYRNFFDVGGWSMPMIGSWTRTQDTVFLFSKPLPVVEYSKEEWKPRNGSVIILQGKNRDWFDAASHLKVLNSNIELVPRFSDSLGVIWTVSDIAFSHGDTISFAVANVIVQYLVQSDSCNNIMLSLNMSDSDCNFFFRNHRLLFNHGMLIRQLDSGEYDHEHPYVHLVK